MFLKEESCIFFSDFSTLHCYRNFKTLSYFRHNLEQFENMQLCAILFFSNTFRYIFTKIFQKYASISILVLKAYLKSSCMVLFCSYKVGHQIGLMVEKFISPNHSSFSEGRMFVDGAMIVNKATNLIKRFKKV